MRENGRVVFMAIVVVAVVVAVAVAVVVVVVVVVAVAVAVVVAVVLAVVVAVVLGRAPMTDDQLREAFRMMAMGSYPAFEDGDYGWNFRPLTHNQSLAVEARIICELTDRGSHFDFCGVRFTAREGRLHMSLPI
jgi:hypothetical protein